MFLNTSIVFFLDAGMSHFHMSSFNVHNKLWNGIMLPSLSGLNWGSESHRGLEWWAGSLHAALHLVSWEHAFDFRPGTQYSQTSSLPSPSHSGRDRWGLAGCIWGVNPCEDGLLLSPQMWPWGFNQKSPSFLHTRLGHSDYVISTITNIIRVINSSYQNNSYYWALTVWQVLY